MFDKERVIQILESSGMTREDVQSRCSELPTWSFLSRMYGDQPVIVGLDTCREHRKLSSRNPGNSVAFKWMVCLMWGLMQWPTHCCKIFGRRKVVSPTVLAKIKKQYHNLRGDGAEDQTRTGYYRYVTESVRLLESILWGLRERQIPSRHHSFRGHNLVRRRGYGGLVPLHRFAS